jgi:hypothetical protein
VELIRQVRRQKPELRIRHVGEPLPAGDPALDGVPSLREPFTPDELLGQVRRLLASPGSATGRPRS